MRREPLVLAVTVLTSMADEDLHEIGIAGSAQEQVLKLAKLHADYDPRDRISALRYLQERHAAGEVVTGLLYLDPEPQDIHAHQFVRHPP